MTETDFSLDRNAFGRLVLTTADGTVHENVVPVRAFPIAAPDDGLSLLSHDGKELVWISRPSALPAATRTLIEEELAGREFMPEIRRLSAVSGFACPCVWYVDTDRGETAFVLKGEEDIRRLTPPNLLITDNNGIHYLVRDMNALDKTSRKLLDRFL
ncbi:MAG: DUF1854 domain-containing protein [Microvirgula sp.]